MAHDVFISYSHKDIVAANAVCSILEKNQVRCWMAPRDISPGAPFAEAIIDGIKASRVFILIYSQNSNSSSQVIKEVDRAVHHGLAIIPLRLEDVPMTKQLEYYVSDVHWLDALTPPLEKHINKLCKVVQLLLKMDDAGNDDIDASIKEKIKEEEGTGIFSKKPKLARIFIPVAALILVAIVAASLWFFKRHADIRWARQEAIPEIRRLIAENDVWRNLVEPYRLAERAEKILRDDPDLAELLSQISLEINVLTEPPGASVYMKDYVKPEEEWTFLGLSPLENVRVPIGIFRWKLEKEGFETVMAAASTWDIGAAGEDSPDLVIPYHLVRKLDEVGSNPEGMVRVPATSAFIGEIPEFFIGRYEVTNREYKQFVDAGAYKNREFWKHPFVNEGRVMTWNEVVETFTDQTGRPGPATWVGGDYPDGQGDYPASGLCWYEAAAYAQWAGMSLPTLFHWNVARGALTPMVRWNQLGGFAVLAPFSNFGGNGPVPVGSLNGVTAFGAFDMAGNVREWCWNEMDIGRCIRGGSWVDNTYEFSNIRQAPAMDRSPRNGFRLAYYPEPDSIPGRVFEKRQYLAPIDIESLKPVSDEIFQIYKEQFAYDKTLLNARVEESVKSPGGWVREKISFDAAYGGERVLAYLFLPENASPPFQTVIYFPGSASTFVPSSMQLENYYEFSMFLSFLVRNGRAVLYPIYKGTFERGEPALTAIHSGVGSYAYTEYLIQIVKDFRRSIDYLETRTDIDTTRLAYYGMSWGGLLGAIIPAVEDRLNVSILLAGGLNFKGRPEANAINYVTRVQIPTLMINGLYDVGIDEEIRPLFNLLGMPTEHKQLLLYETDHIPPRTEYIKESLNWLDKYFGPVR